MGLVSHLYAEHASSEERNHSELNHEGTLVPIRVGAMVRQPAPDIADVLYVGSASLLLSFSDRKMRSAGGIFYARIQPYPEDVLEPESEYALVLEIAALPHYFDAGPATRRRHVGEIVVTTTEWGAMLEWDRSFAGLPTCDLAKLLEEHAQTYLRQVQQYHLEMMEDVHQECDHPVEARDEITGGASAPTHEDEWEMDLVPLAMMFRLPQGAVRSVCHQLHIRRDDRRIQTVVLLAAMDVLARQLDRCYPGARRDLEALYYHLKRLQGWRRHRHYEVCHWQRVATFDFDGCAWYVTIGIPREQVADVPSHLLAAA